MHDESFVYNTGTSTTYECITTYIQVDFTVYITQLTHTYTPK